MAEHPIKIPAPSILIILMGSLGDVARGLSLVSHIKANRPQSHITWLVEPNGKELVGLHPQIDKIIMFNRAWSIRAVWDLYCQLRAVHFDITLDLQRHLKSGFFSLLSGSKLRLGFHRDNAKELNWIFNTATIPYFSEDLPKLEHYYKFLEYFGFPQPPAPDFGFSDWNERPHLPPLIAESDKPVVAVVMGSRWETKNWLRDGYMRLIQLILEKKTARAVLIGDPSQRADANYIAETIDQSALINLVGKTSLTELTAVLKHSKAAVGPDSGPGHLAAAVGTPYIALFGPTSARRTAPYGCEHLVVQTELDCMPCYQKQCPEHTRQCMHDIRVEQIMDKLNPLLTMKG